MEFTTCREKLLQRIILRARSLGIVLKSLFSISQQRSSLFSSILCLGQMSVECLRGSRFGMPLSQRVRTDDERAFGQRAGFPQVALSLPQARQVMQRLRCLGMILTQLLLSDGKCALIQLPRLLILSLFR